MPVWSETIESEIRVPGITVQIVASDWDMPEDFERWVPGYGIALVLSPPRSCTRGCYSTKDASGSCVTTGQVVFGPADARLRAHTSGGMMRNLACFFERGKFEELTGLGDRWHPDILSESLDIRNPKLTQTLQRLAQEAMSPGFASNMMIECLGLLSAVELARHFGDLGTKSKSGAQTLLPWQMQRATEYLDNLAQYTPDIDDIAALCGVGSRHLRRLFKQTTNQTIYEYARGVWTAKAKAFLSDTDLPLKEIASRLGFADPSSFSTAFRRVVGDTPRSYRQRFRRRAG